MATGECRRILVVDDHEDAAVLLQEYLQTFGMDVRIAHDGPTALVVAAEFRPEIVLVDIGMPGMDGYEVLRRLREPPYDPRLRAVAITGFQRDFDRERAESAVFDAHLVKPVPVDTLTKLIDELSRNRTASRAA